MLGSRIAVQRRRKGLSQAELARRVHISASAVGMYEQGRREPSFDILIALSRELDVSTDYLLTGIAALPKEAAPCAAVLVCAPDDLSETGAVYPLSRQEFRQLFSTLFQKS